MTLRPTRRLAATLAALLALLPAACGSPGEGGAEVVVAGPGGDLGGNYRTAFADFTRETGVEVRYVEGLTVQQVAQIAAQRENPQIDVLLGTGTSYHLGLDQDLWSDLSPTVLEQRSALPEFARLKGDREVTPLVNVPVLFYNVEEFQNNGLTPPTDYLDVLADERLRGHVAFPDISNGYMETYLGLALEESGLPVDDPTPAVQALFAKGRDWFYQFPQTPSEMAQLVSSGTVWAGLDGATRVNDMRLKGMPVERVVPPRLAAIPLSWSAVRNSPNPEPAQRLLGWSITVNGQESLLRNTRINTSTDVPVPDELRGQVLSAEEMSRVRSIDDEGISAAADTWSAAWARLVAG